MVQVMNLFSVLIRDTIMTLQVFRVLINDTEFWQTNERPGSDHVMWGPMRGLAKNCMGGYKIHGYIHGYERTGDVQDIFYYQNRDQDFWKPSLDIKTRIKTFENLVLILRLVLRLLKWMSWYQEWHWDSLNCSLDIETGIETFKIPVLILRLVSRLSGSES